MQNISLEDLRKIFELKEHEPSLSQQNIADKLHIAKSTVNKYLNLAKEQNLANDSILAMDEEELSITFNLKSRQKDFIQPNWENVDIPL
ncbi:MAG: winged helix-turn-helix transcriptional regulator [Succinatimonas sp.]|nr:winged helix-turn-helix transcriptional regulator [Succinatimonas sp.]